MSVRLMSLVWDRFKTGGSEKLALLALADWASDDGESVHPSMASIAEKINVSRSQAQRIVHGLIADGWLHVVGNELGGAPGASRQYRIDVEKLRTGRMDATPPRASTGRTDATPQKAHKGRANDTRTGSAHATGRTDATGRTGAAGRVAPVRQTGRMDAQDGSHPCDTNHHISIREPSVEPPVSDAPKRPAPSAATWAAYAEAYQRRYQVPPVRNAKVNGMLARLVERLGQEAPDVARYYLSINSQFYVNSGHCVELLLRDAEKLRTEWATGRRTTNAQARQIDATQANFNVFSKIIAEEKAAASP